jgi:hypothetical protein
MSRDRSDPRISITKFAEYLVTTTPGRRRSILTDQRFPPAFKATKFRAAYAPIADILVRGGDPELVDEQIAIWRRQKPASKFQAECLALCIDALTALKAILERGALMQFSFAPGLPEAHIELGGVKVSVRPEALIGGPEIGAVKIYLSKTNPLTKDGKGKLGSAGFAGAALHLWAEEAFGNALPERCLVVDVFAGEVYKAPSRNAIRRKHMLAACEEITAVWPWLKSPPAAPLPRASAGGAP